MILIRSLAYVTWLYVSILVVGLGGAPLAAFSRVWARRMMRALAYSALFGLRVICNVRVKVEGREHIPKGPAIVAAKHQSMFDTLAPFTLLDDPAMVVKQELADLPMFGWYMAWGRMIPVDRGAHSRALKGMARAAIQEIATGRQLVIFPEGTRQPVGARPNYKPGVALIYREMGLACTPVALNSGRCWPAHGIIRRPGTITIRFLPAIPPGLSREEFMRELETRIETAMDTLTEQPIKRAA
jgi:1-acyl-sn-glycerol-3-phosphate acyltransferase